MRQATWRKIEDVSTWRELAPEIPFPTADEYARLKASLLEDGQQVAVVVDETGRAIDGNTRIEALIELGEGRVFVEERTGLTTEQKRDLAISLNANRRQMTPEAIHAIAEARRERVAKMRYEQAQSIRTIAEAERVSPTTIKNDLAAIEAAAAAESPEPESGVQGFTPDGEASAAKPAKPAPPAKITGADGKKYDATRPKPAPKQPEPMSIEKQQEFINQRMAALFPGRAPATPAPAGVQGFTPDSVSAEPQSTMQSYVTIRETDPLEFDLQRIADHLNKAFEWLEHAVGHAAESSAADEAIVSHLQTSANMTVKHFKSMVESISKFETLTAARERIEASADPASETRAVFMDMHREVSKPNVKVVTNEEVLHG